MKLISNYKYYYIDASLLRFESMQDILLLITEQEKNRCVVTCAHDLFEKELIEKNFSSFHNIFIGNSYQEIKQDLATRIYSPKQILIISEDQPLIRSFQEINYHVLAIEGIDEEKDKTLNTIIEKQTRILRKRNKNFCLSIVLIMIGFVLMGMINISPYIEIGIAPFVMGMVGAIYYGGSFFIRELLDVF